MTAAPTAQQAIAALQAAGRPDRITTTEKFFKAYPGGYSEGDQFLCVSVPVTRQIGKDFRDLSLTEIAKLLTSKWHDARLMAVIILVERYKRGDDAERQAIYDLYMSHTAYVNNWDIVDSSAGYIVGTWLDGKPEKMSVLCKLADSDLLWERRIAILATFAYIKDGRADEGLVIAEQLLHDEHDLMHKAVGWMLREIGKRVDRQLLLQFLDQHAATMPRTTLRYAIEHLGPDQRAHYLALKGAVQ